MSSLTGKNVLIVRLITSNYEAILTLSMQTGASMGIGLSIAMAAAAKGANLILFSRTEVCTKIQTCYFGTWSILLIPAFEY